MSDPNVPSEYEFTTIEEDPRNWSWVVQQWECFKKIKSIQTGPRERISEFVLREILSRHYEVEPDKLTPRHLREAMVDLIHHYRSVEIVQQAAPKDNAGGSQKTELQITTPAMVDRQPNDVGSVGNEGGNATSETEQVSNLADEGLVRVRRADWREDAANGGEASMAAIQSGVKLAGLSPKQRQKLEEMWAALSQEDRATIEASFAEMSRVGKQAGEYQRSLLRQLGVESSDDFEEFWLKSWAAARLAGISDEEFWNLTPRQICVILEARAGELEVIARGSEPGARRVEQRIVPAPGEPSLPEPTSDVQLDLTSELGRSNAVESYQRNWTRDHQTCSEASLARTARVDPADLSKWKKGLLPNESDKKRRIEHALKNNDPPTPARRGGSGL